ncbi:DUF805 domain-containing protein [Avibacterium paragallinarum]|uniref:DUF805 domain-containing protein n=2 Tax=Avibacterium paragallinarum TaxID=728 RepID=A0AAE5WJ16_AVIPA|nr:DUF805 domain-containing protein [Avibacterium paragallinarum]MEE3669016.1 DUF805 domain-containing protein [Avibacterium paragallinarum]MEE3682082.1 DUF805 domain-containing protein [Avibacterium paragallinarum]PXZ40608.1 hypothetical protein DM482_00225 [Avibacterium paragallinarum]PXZ41807.1 hypothetical protein DM481_03940 [Avibacterium paragallinarum]QZP16653.1 DUF805 domain-containing protein [Avibacterium paragallinarum]
MFKQLLTNKAFENIYGQLFSFDGKVGRGKYFFYATPCLLIAIFLFISFLYFYNKLDSHLYFYYKYPDYYLNMVIIDGSLTFLSFLSFLLFIYIFFSFSIRRLNDLLLSKKWVLIILIPLINLLLLFILFSVSSIDSKKEP